MSEEKKEEAAPAEAKPKSKKMLIIIIAVVLVLAIGGAGAFFMLGGSKDSEGDGEGGDEETAATEGAGSEGGEAGHEGELPGALFPLDPFIVNLQVKGSFLKASLQLEFATPEPPPTIDGDVPKIRDSVIRVLASRAASEILNNEGKEKLREDIKAAANEAIGSEEVTQVYFTDFIVQ